MSAISGIGGSGLSQYLLALQASQNSQTAGAQGASNSVPTSALAALAGNGGSSHAHGRHKSDSHSIAGTGVGTPSNPRIQQLQNAVLNSLQSSQSNPTTDSNTVVQNAIASVFKNSLNASATATNSTDSDTSATNATSDADTLPSDFSQTLQQYGIDPEQFQQDFQTAVQQAQGGQINPSTAFQSFPPGVMVDTTA